MSLHDFSHVYPGEFCEDSGLPCQDCPFCQGERCAVCAGPCPVEEDGWNLHGVSERHEGVQPVEARGL